jgi:hypothetical protein
MLGGSLSVDWQQVQDRLMYGLHLVSSVSCITRRLAFYVADG